MSYGTGVLKRAALVLAAILTIPARAGPPPPGTVLHVDDDAPGGGNGLSWATAYRFLEDALAFASIPAHVVTEIRVAEGVYVPGQTDANPGGDTFPGTTFFLSSLNNGLALKGGYAGLSAPNPDARDVAAYETVLSGDIGQPGVVQDNVWHVIWGYYVESLLVEGFTITRGNARNINSVEHDEGGGMSLLGDKIVIRDCTFIANLASQRGAGLALYAGARVVDCTFIGNSAVNGTGGGLGLYSSIAAVIGCRFVGNTAFYNGGGLDNYSSPYSDLVVVNCEFVGNSAGLLGGGIFARGSHVLVADTTFAGNSAAFGGGFASDTNSGGLDATLTNCTLAYNVASSQGGGAYHDDFQVYAPHLTNCILWGNADSGGTDQSAQVDGQSFQPAYLNFCCVQGLTSGLGGVGNIGAAPLFADPSGPDGVPGTEDDDLGLRPGSPCIDAGSNAAVPPDQFDLDGDGDTDEAIELDASGHPRFVDDPDTPDCQQAPGLCGGAPVVDMGAKEFQVCLQVLSQTIVCHGDGTTFTVSIEGINSCTGDTLMFTFTSSGGDPGEELCFTVALYDHQGIQCCSTQLCVTVPACLPGALPCDLDGDGFIGVTDLLMLLAAWGCDPGGPPDFNADGVVGIEDMLLLLASWGPCP